MKNSSIFQPRATSEVDGVVSEHPFAQVVSAHDGQLVCTPLPLLLERGAGDDAWLIGHFARANPHVKLLRQQPRALALFMGASGYISPSWMQDRTQAPTWNYETLHFDIEITFDDSKQAVDDALQRLVAQMESGRAQQWSATDMGLRYERLASAVIAFRARIVQTQAKFKLGQNERKDVYDDILRGLSENGQPALAAKMRRANEARDRQVQALADET